MGYDDWALGKGYMTQEQWHERAAARGIGTAIGIGIVGAGAIVGAAEGGAMITAGWLRFKKAFGLLPKHLNVGNVLTKAESKMLPSIWRGQNPLSTLPESARNALARVYDQSAAIAGQHATAVAFNHARATFMRGAGENPGLTMREFAARNNLSVPGKAALP